MAYINISWLVAWKDTATNPWGQVLEQARLTGEYRHRDFGDNLNCLPWKTGPHPIAQALRDKGQTQTQGFLQ